ncbi:MAG: TerC family protein [Coriobacteriia bacterium]|nr:TerC family protein [Coriobacteriia bacterium]
MLASFSSPTAWVAVLTLSLLEIVLGIDNLVFIAILSERLEGAKRKAARQLGLAAALVTRLALLFSLSWIARLTKPLFEIAWIPGLAEPLEVTGRTLVLLGGGLFLMYKAVSEIYHKVELKDEGVRKSPMTRSLGLVVLNIALMDVIFSLDSVITAVGMVNDIPIMVAGIIIAMIVMIAFADPVANFICDHAAIKILALAFLLMVGMLLTAEGLHFSIPKGFVYFAMFFSLGVQAIQMRYDANLTRARACTTGVSGTRVDKE